MRYEIRFDAEIPVDLLRQVLAEDFKISPQRIYGGDLADRPLTGDSPVAIITPPVGQERFGWILTGDADLATGTGLNETDLARHLSRRLTARALVDDGTDDPDRWLLITPDGGSGAVVTDEDAALDGDLVITYALEPISGAPDFSVAPEREWPARPGEG